MQGTLIDIEPKNLLDAVRNECKNCKLLRKIDAIEGEVCCSKKMNRILIVRMLWLDEST